MDDLRELYQEVILDHNRHPRNFSAMEGASAKAEGYNPLCGDQLTLYLKSEGDQIKDLSFQGSGCAISKASASLMTEALKGKSKQEALELFKKFHHMVTGSVGEEPDPSLGKLAVFAGVCEYPARVKCASLAWHTLKNALEGKGEVAKTEG
ncbi:MAG: SUF system NifU family Fe-S cluster assembly protein [Deltaproteobacteria bacterium]|nr:SUF system NifU family Fe-S cluster assembly protein [Deltaproteobacteria bacterium]